MSNPIAFCSECRQDAKYSVNENMEIAELKGKVYEYVSHTAYCRECGGEVYVAELEDINLNALYDAYRRRNDIISLEDIRAIPEKYNIGKRPLSLLLGWGEQTFSRYFGGDMPTKQYSDTMKRINADPAYFLSLLNGCKDNLKSDMAYKKSKATTEMLLNTAAVSHAFNSHERKIDVVADYLVSQCRDITNLALQKALYYVQGFYYAFYGTFLFAEDCEAWAHGPVYRDIYRRYSNYCFDPIEGLDDFDVSVLSEEEKLLLDSIIRHICCYSGKTLEAFTHGETPWISTRTGLPEGTPSNRIIPKQSIGGYFTEVKEKYRMLTPANAKDYAQNIFAQLGLSE